MIGEAERGVSRGWVEHFRPSQPFIDLLHPAIESLAAHFMTHQLHKQWRSSGRRGLCKTAQTTAGRMFSRVTNPGRLAAATPRQRGAPATVASGGGLTLVTLRPCGMWLCCSSSSFSRWRPHCEQSFSCSGTERAPSAEGITAMR